MEIRMKARQRTVIVMKLGKEWVGCFRITITKANQ